MNGTIAKMMVKYVECKEENGFIIALDQEKVYNKICHNYLDKTLEAYNLPEGFRKIIKSLYKSAEMVVMINGTPSVPFKVSRGVQQGDPLSCLLFNLTIAPLANLGEEGQCLAHMSPSGCNFKQFILTQAICPFKIKTQHVIL